MIWILISDQVYSCPKKVQQTKNFQNGFTTKSSTIDTKNYQKRSFASGFWCGNATECHHRRVEHGPRVRVVRCTPSTVPFPSAKVFAIKQLISGKCSQPSSLEDVHADLVDLDLHRRRRVEKNIRQTWFGKNSMKVLQSLWILKLYKIDFAFIV